MTYKIFKRLPSLVQQNDQNLIQVLHPSSKKNRKNTTSLFSSVNPLLKNQKYFSTCNNKDGNSKYGENLAVVLHGIKDLKLEKREVPKISDNQVLLQMEVVGICGSDVHYYLDGKIGTFEVTKPMIIGHEASGTVLECGKAVKNLKPGDKVAVEPQVTCRKCSYCKSGNYHLCPNLFFCATPPDDGNLSRYYAHDSDFCHKLPCNLDFEHGTLMEPLAVGVHSCKRAQVTSGDSVLIIGSGPIGLVSLLAAKAYGASRTMVLDINEFKLEKAIQMGADYGLNVKDCSDEDIVKIIHETFGHHPNKTIECCGSEQALKVGLYSTKSGGKLVLAGIGKDIMCLPMSQIIFREVDVLGVFRYVNDYPTAIDMVRSGKIDPKPLITHHFKLEDSIEAFKTASDGKINSIKIMIHANPEWKAEKAC